MYETFYNQLFLFSLGGTMFKKLILSAFLISSIASIHAHAELVILAEGFAPHANLVADFEALTGEKVVITDAPFADNLVMLQNYSDPKALAQPGAVKPDLIIAKDLVFLSEVKNQGLTQAFDPLAVFNNIKPGMMDSKDLHWVGITYRARTLAYGTNVDVSSINTYADLAKPEWAGRLCVRTSDNSYNYGLVSFLIAEYGYDDAKDILLGWMDNLAMPVFRGDTLILNAINSGECEVGIVNHYYLARELDKAQGQGTQYNVNLKILNQGQGGVHTNGYGVALLKTSSEKALAQKFVEMLLSEKAQVQISTSQFAYPVIANVKAQTLIQAWGEFETSPLVWSELGENLDLAEQLMQEVDYE